MAYMSSARFAVRLLRQTRLVAALQQSCRALSIDIDTFKDKETAEEAVFFSKNDERLLRGLLKKIKNQADTTDKDEAAEETACEMTDLKKVLGKYNVSESDLQELMKWKHGQS